MVPNILLQKSRRVLVKFTLKVAQHLETHKLWGRETNACARRNTEPEEMTGPNLASPSSGGILVALQLAASRADKQAGRSSISLRW